MRIGKLGIYWWPRIERSDRAGLSNFWIWGPGPWFPGKGRHLLSVSVLGRRVQILWEAK
jgi:hypothetical protein